MADIDNLAEINENFDTVKTLLNSIRAQGILNTSDVDKLLSGINAKLEKINTDEDIDLIKVFLTELKQSLDERHSILVSKFGAIEALFSNLLKNSNELPKSSELKELFDIVATNLSVFSREVVAQKESLTDITLRLDSMRSDDSQKKDIIKSISMLKPDLERVSNGFDTIVLSLNDNFKTIVKAISSMDKTEHLDKFADSLNSIEMSSNALLSAIQLLDKKAEAVDESVKSLITKEDLESTEKSIKELKLLNENLNNSVTEIDNNYAKIDNLADKIDASVNIIASLKSTLEDADDKKVNVILENLNNLGEQLNKINDDTKFEEFKNSLNQILLDITQNTRILDKNLNSSSENINSILESLKALDMEASLSSILSAIESNENEIKNHISERIQTFADLSEANLSQILSNITSGTDSLNTRINQTQSEISLICEGSFSTVFENIAELKKLISQIDENGVSANNAMFSNISDRLNLFENALKESLETQEHTSNEASAVLCEQVENIKNLSNVLDYKMDSSVVEISNMTRMFETLKQSVDGILALNFVETVKDLRADIYASKQDLSNALESSAGNLSENFTNDLYGKYELIISKIDSVEDSIRNTQMESLGSIKEITEKISDSIVDILSYVSDSKEFPLDEIDRRIAGISDIVKENNLNYVENVREIVDLIRAQVDNNLKSIEEEYVKRFDYIQRSIELNSDDIKKDIKNSYEKLVEIKTAYEEIKNLMDINSVDSSNRFDKLFASANGINSEFESKLNTLKVSLLDKISEFKNDFTCDNAEKVNEFKFAVETMYSKNAQDIVENLDSIKIQLDKFASENLETRTDSVEKIFEDFTDLKNLISNFNTVNSETREQALERIYTNFDHIESAIKSLSSDMAEGRSAGLTKITDELSDIKNSLNAFKEETDDGRNYVLSKIYENYEDLKNQIEKFADENNSTRTTVLAKLLENFVGIKDYISSQNKQTAEDLTEKTESIMDCFRDVKAVLNKVDENVDGDMTRQLSIIESNFESLISQMTILNEKAEQSLVEKINDEYKEISLKIDANVTQKLEEYKYKIEESFDELSNKAQAQSSYIQDRISDINTALKSAWQEQSAENIRQIDEISDRLKEILDNNIELTAVDYAALKSKLEEFTKEVSANNEILAQNLKAQLDDMTRYVDSVLDIQTQESEARVEEYTGLINTLSEKISFESAKMHSAISENNNLSNEIKAELSAISPKVDNNEYLINNLSDTIKERSEKTGSLIEEVGNAIQNDITDTVEKLEDFQNSVYSRNAETQSKLDGIIAAIDENSQRITEITAEAANAEMKSIETESEKLLEQFELTKQSISAINDFISETMQKKLKAISTEIEKETDAILAEITGQFDLVKKSQQDTSIQITTGIESIVETQIYNNIEDLKSYLDVKTDSSVLVSKLDNLKIDMTSAVENVISDMNKMLNADVFTTAMTDYRVANEILVNSAADRINEKIADFIGNSSQELSGALNVGIKDFESKLALFDKKFIDTVVDKYEEIKLISNQYNSALDDIKKSINTIIVEFKGVRGTIETKVDELIEAFKSTSERTNIEIRQLNNCFENLRSQISNKSFDEAFQASINKQVASLEKLIKEQLGYIEDINDLCEINLPDVSELNTLVKGAVIKMLQDLSEKFENRINQANNLIVSTASNLSEQIETHNIEGLLEESLKETKADIITQFLNIFNQISFVAEQEEIIDYIQERHDELITILSHIVTTTGDISYIKDEVTVVDDKLSSLKDEINIINEKITNIISSDGDIDYVYSLQDLESDIANLRIVLKDMKEQNDSYSNEFGDLMSSTENIYKLVESIKDEIPDKKTFDSLSEDIVSISTRTNKLILASDESYKTLQDNLRDFKLVIDDLDERTRNFAQESGMDKIDLKLNALNTMVQNGAKTNQVFNQVFEYLAEWVDSAGTKINKISNKVETLDDIGQIKVMLADLKAEAEDNSENVELIEALGNVFDKQAKKISDLETKLDKMIVENTINNQNKLDIKPMEDTLNKFLAAIGEKMTSQQEKINSLESTLDRVINILDEKDTAQLTKKVGGMDRQIAKLNKSIEKIASHVVEK